MLLKIILYCFAAICLRILKIRNRDSVHYPRYGPKPWGSNRGSGKKLTSSSAVGLHSQLLSRYRGPFLGVKRPGLGVDHSPPSRAEVKNEWSYTSIPLYDFKPSRRDKCTFYF
jgi:hypothetical protein